MTNATSNSAATSSNTSWPAAVDKTTFPDDPFRTYVTKNISGKDGDPATLTKEEADAVTNHPTTVTAPSLGLSMTIPGSSAPTRVTKDCSSPGLLVSDARPWKYML